MLPLLAMFVSQSLLMLHCCCCLTLTGLSAAIWEICDSAGIYTSAADGALQALMEPLRKAARLQGMAAKSSSRHWKSSGRQRHKWRQQAKMQRSRSRGLQRDMHVELVNYVMENYDVVLLPDTVMTFDKVMKNRRTRIMSRTISHSRLVARMKMAATTHPTTLVVSVSERCVLCSFSAMCVHLSLHSM